MYMRRSLCAIVPFIMLMVLVVVLSLNAIGHTPPPQMGDWIISDETSISNDKIVMNGNIYVKNGGKLVLNNVELLFKDGGKTKYMFKVETGGILQMDSCTIEGYEGARYYFMAERDTNIKISSCKIKNVGDMAHPPSKAGLCILTSDAVIENSIITEGYDGVVVHGNVAPSIISCKIYNNSGHGIRCVYSYPKISSCEIYENGGHGIFVNESYPTITNGKLYNNLKKNIYTDDKSFITWSINGETSVINGTSSIIGNISIKQGGLLRIISSEIEIGGNILIGQLGIIILDECKIISYENKAYTFTADDGSTVSINRCNIECPKIGMSIYADNFIMSDSTITSSDVGIIFNSSDGKMLNTTLETSAASLILTKSHLHMTNCSYGDVILNDDDSYIEEGWFLTVVIHWNGGNSASDVFVSISDKDDNVVFSGATDKNGIIGPIQLIKHVVKKDGKHPKVPYTIKSNYKGIKGENVQTTLNKNEIVNVMLVDPEEPKLNITSPENNEGFNTTKIKIEGKCSDNLGIFEVRVKILNISLRWYKANLKGDSWEIDYPMNLTDGTYTVVVECEDIGGLTTERSVIIHVDTKSPDIYIDEPYGGELVISSSEVIIKGRTEKGATVMTSDGKWSTISNNEGEFVLKVNLTEGTHNLRIIAVDLGGNSVSALVKITIDLTPPVIIVESPENGTKTEDAVIIIKGKTEQGSTVKINNLMAEVDDMGNFKMNLTIFSGENEIIINSTDVAGNTNSTVIYVIKEEKVNVKIVSVFEIYGIWIVVTIIVSVAIIVAVILVVRKKRKKVKETEFPQKEIKMMTEDIGAGGRDEGKPPEGGAIDDLLYGGGSPPTPPPPPQSPPEV